MPTEPLDESQLRAAEEALGVVFDDKSLLRESLTHQSFINENPGVSAVSNERLEFLGDGFLNFVVAHQLFTRAPQQAEGELTARRAQAVRRETLADIGQRMRLGGFLVMGRGEAASGGAERESNRANAFEAVVGAVLLDRGFRFARAFVLRWMKREIVRILAAETPKDPKSLLQEILQSRGRATPAYRLTGTSGPPEHRRFSVIVEVDGVAMGEGAGRRKIEAEREAAGRAIDRLLAGETLRQDD